MTEPAWSLANVCTIPAGAPFVDALAAGILAQVGHDPAALTRVTVLLPTRRACRSLRDAFLRQSGGTPMLLPRLSPVGDIDEDELAIGGGLSDDDISAAPGGTFDLPPAIPGLKRQLMLAQLILAKDPGTKVEQAARLAAELARLLDQVHTERLSFDALPGLVEEREFADHWQVTLEFLTILTTAWPSILAEENALDPADRRNRLLEAQAEFWRNQPPDHPIIAAGSTGTIPATADLLEVVAGLPKGCVVLPGLDQDCDDTIWDNLGLSHPQYGMKRLLDQFGMGRKDVSIWPAKAFSTGAPGRQRLTRLALMPPETTGTPSDDAITPQDIDGITRIDAPDPQAEAKSIALILRHALDTPGRTAALVTPDRPLARRVTEELRRWDIAIDDSAGRSLAETPPGAYLRLTARMAADDLSPVPLLAALKHPFAAGGIEPAKFRSWARDLERLILRGPRPGSGIRGLRAAISAERNAASDANRKHHVKSLDEINTGLNGFEEIYNPFARMMADKAIPLGDLLAAHIAFAEALAASDDAPGAETLWRGEDGEAAASFIAGLADTAPALSHPIDPGEYPALIETLMAAQVVRPRHSRHARLNIWGNLEARLQHADIMVLGSLNEGTWPPEAKPNPWMSRPMAQDFGLPLPERRIGLSAHDFAQAVSAPHVVITRADRVGGAPTTPSRWLQRLANLMTGDDLKTALDTRENWLGWAAGMDQPDGPPRPVAPPEPRPPVSARPRQLSVTRIRTLVRDPYAIYADKILKLRPLDPIDADPDARHKGIAIHTILDQFIEQYPDHIPDDAEERLIKIGEETFAKLMAWPTVRALWWPRFERIAHAFVDWERKRRESGIKTVASEVRGSLNLELPAGTFELTAIADRIDRLANDGLSILDYKTGAAPSEKAIRSGLESQLPLEAAIAEAGGFGKAVHGAVTNMLYVLVSGGPVPVDNKQAVRKEDDVRDTIDTCVDGITRMLSRYDLEGQPYRSRPRVQFEDRPGDYDHLARFKEWGIGGGDDE